MHACAVLNCCYCHCCCVSLGHAPKPVPFRAIIECPSLTLSACARVTVLIVFVCVCVCVCVCVSLTTLDATLIYSAKNGHQWTANGILFILKKLKSCKSAPSIQKQLSKLCIRTSYSHAHLLKFKVHFEGTA